MNARFQIAAEALRANRAARALVVTVRPVQTSRLTISFSCSVPGTELETRSLVEVRDTPVE